MLLRSNQKINDLAEVMSSNTVLGPTASQRASRSQAEGAASRPKPFSQSLHYATN